MEINNKDNLKSLIWLYIFVIIMTVLSGLLGSAFSFATLGVTSLRLTYPWFLFLLPFGGMAVTFLYKIADFSEDGGVVRIIDTIRGDNDTPFRMAPLIFSAATISHLCGASIGRVGTSLQLGGSVANTISKLFKIDEKHRNILMLCSMSGVFSAFFGTPLAGSILSIELLGIRGFAYHALIPCIISAFGARAISHYMGVPSPNFIISGIPEIGFHALILVAFVSAIAGLVAMLYYTSLSFFRIRLGLLIKNPYIRGFIGGCVLLFLTYLWGFEAQTYNGIGAALIKTAMEGNVSDLSFLWKILFTAISVGIGYKGGEVYPAIFVGATFGSALGAVLGFYPSFLAAICIICLFTGILKCPIASLFLSYEFFGANGTLLFVIAIAISYFTSGRGGIYRSRF